VLLFSMSPKLSDKKLAVLGAGKLGGILLRAYLKQGLFVPDRVVATVKHAERAAALAKELDIAVTPNNREAVKDADIVLLTTKPQTVGEVLREIAPEIGADTLIVSVAASVPVGFVEQRLAAGTGGKRDKVPVVRAMPNTPAAVHCGMTASVVGRMPVLIISVLLARCSIRWAERLCLMRSIWTRLQVFLRAALRLRTSFWNRWPKLV
jgi:pyrroline-5-carboxylate reductase